MNTKLFSVATYKIKEETEMYPELNAENNVHLHISPE
jgi:hypothetical protein